ncbi:MAG TPA: peptidoglycan DD-metalloendopeptidase family protein [Saprospiraceae bacterium]|nr:peptidoglycan DD-metalloendopeptidase family protein [Saprospiraceae bacterium]
MKKYNVSIKAWSTAAFLFLACVSFGQKNREDLESQRKALESQIRSTTEILEKTQKSKTKSIKELKALNVQISQRQELLATINNELSRLKRESALHEQSKNLAAKSISQFEERLNHALRMSYVRKQLQPDWIYLLSAQSISQALTRWVYLRQYKSFIAQQLKELAVKKSMHQQFISIIEENKKEKTRLFLEEEQERRKVQTAQKSQEALLSELGKEEKKLKNQLAGTQAKKKKLDDEIARLISEEGKKMNTSGLAKAPETKALNDKFASNKGKLPWPVGKGMITGRFGNHPHPVLKGIMVQNNGIDIEAESGAGVKSLFGGTVASVTRIPGYDYMVMVRHGLYFTVYSKIVNATVKKGDNVTTGQVLGYLAKEDPELHLEIWQDKTKLNPESWIAKK